MGLISSLFGKKRIPLTVKEIEDGIYNGFLSFTRIEPSNFYQLIISFKRKHPNMCPKSLSLSPEKMHSTEIYGLIWMYIIYFLQDNGLKVNIDRFKRGEYFGDMLDIYVVNARYGFKRNSQLDQFWEDELDIGLIKNGSNSANRQIKSLISSENNRILEETLKRSLKEKKVIDTTIPWHISLLFINERSFWQVFTSTNQIEVEWSGIKKEQNSDELFAHFIRSPDTNTTKIKSHTNVVGDITSLSF